MKKNIYITGIILFLLSIGCFSVPTEPKKPPVDENKVEYPESGSFGPNLIKSEIIQSAILTDTRYSMHFTITGSKTVRIVIMNSVTWEYVIDPPPIGWLKNPFKIINGMGIFSTQEEGIYDIGIIFHESPGNQTEIKIYEGLSSEPSRIIQLQVEVKK